MEREEGIGKGDVLLSSTSLRLLRFEFFRGSSGGPGSRLY